MKHRPFIPDAPHIFLVVPFNEKHGAVQQEMRAAATTLGLGCFRTDDIRQSTSILDRVLQGIRSATVVVADLTENRVNCYYELGYADALKRPVVLLCHEGTEPAVDVSGRSICRYRDAEHLKAELPIWLMEAALVNRTQSTSDDRNAGRYGRLAIRDEYLLSAHMELDDPDEQMRVWVTATVRRIDAKPLPSNAKIKFFLDESLNPGYQEGEIVNGIARCAFQCHRAFSLGAKVATTALELDLRHIPGTN
ncbi:hypothetical protein [Tahibacter sp.]|uniref:hypothetical protein n=1 Tax=Tahibacter sp. TaxID=2056211 RepID=UPI0028C4D436|nr:hypothetical protein [Tahibacter sp.]